MKKIDHIIILHGIGANPFIMWFPWLRLKLELLGIRVEAPILPHSFKPDLTEWKRAAKKVLQRAGPSTMIIGHSLGGTLAMHLLDEAAVRRVGCVTLVSTPIARTLNVARFLPFFETPLNWSGIRKRADRFLILHAKNDPVVPCDHAVRYGELLGVTPMLIEKGRHFDGIRNLALFDLISPLLKKP